MIPKRGAALKPSEDACVYCAKIGSGIQELHWLRDFSDSKVLADHVTREFGEEYEKRGGVRAVLSWWFTMHEMYGHSALPVWQEWWGQRPATKSLFTEEIRAGRKRARLWDEPMEE